MGHRGGNSLVWSLMLVVLALLAAQFSAALPASGAADAPTAPPVLYAVGQGGVTPIPTATDTPGDLIGLNVSGLFYPVFNAPLFEAMDPSGSTLWVTGTDGQTTVFEPISVSSGTAGTPTAIPGTVEPTAIAVSADDTTVWVLSEGDSANSLLTPYSIAGQSLGTSLPVCNGARSLALTADGSTAYVACSASEVQAVNLSSASTQDIPVPLAPTQVALAVTGGTSYVIAVIPTGISVTDLATDTTARLTIPGITAMTVSPDGSTAWIVATNKLYSVNVAAGQISSSFSICASCSGVSVVESQSGTALYVYAAGEVIPASTDKAYQPVSISTSASTDPQMLAITPASAPPPLPGSLTVSASGLLPNFTAQLEVAGPDGYSATVPVTASAPAVVGNLTPGAYTVTAGLACDESICLVPAQASWDATVGSAQSQTLAVSFAPQQEGGLAVDITGLPAGTDLSTIDGGTAQPGYTGVGGIVDGLGGHVGTSQVVTLLPGTYAISEPNPVQVNGASYVASISQPTVTVTSGQVTAVTVAFVEQPATGSAIEAVGGTGSQSAMAGTQFDSPLEVRVTSDGEPDPGAAVTFTAPVPAVATPGAIFGGGSGAGTSTTTLTTDADGYASVPVTGGTVSGDYTISATSPGATSATFSMHNVQNAVTSTLTSAESGIVGKFLEASAGLTHSQASLAAQYSVSLGVNTLTDIQQCLQELSDGSGQQCTADGTELLVFTAGTVTPGGYATCQALPSCPVLFNAGSQVALSAAWQSAEGILANAANNPAAFLTSYVVGDATLDSGLAVCAVATDLAAPGAGAVACVVGAAIVSGAASYLSSAAVASLLPDAGNQGVVPILGDTVTCSTETAPVLADCLNNALVSAPGDGLSATDLINAACNAECVDPGGLEGVVTATSTNPVITSTAATYITVQGEGTGTLSTGVYAGDFTGESSLAKPFVLDVSTTSGSALTSTVISDCAPGLSPSSTFQWWNGTWQPMSLQTYDATSECLLATVNSATSPSISQLGGTPLAVGTTGKGSAPAIASVHPASGPGYGGTAVTVSGSHLGNVISVLVGGTPAVFTILSATKILVLSPAHVGGSARIQVTGPFGTSKKSAADTFTYNATLALTPGRGVPRAKVIATVSGFSRAQTVTVHWGSPTGPIIGTLITGKTGMATVQFIVPKVKAGSYNVYAVAGKRTARSAFKVSPGKPG